MTGDIEHLGSLLFVGLLAERRQRLFARDRLFLLAGVLAHGLSLPEIAAYCRSRILLHNRGHLVAQWPSIADACGEENFVSLVRQVERRYGAERVERIAASDDFEPARERLFYTTDGEFAAAILGLAWEDLRREYRSGNL